ncbi:hypothetical protein ABPG72_010812 [Tetrahymena utriculariae]
MVVYYYRQICGQSQYFDRDNMDCLNCVSNCLDCSDGQSCIRCKIGYIPLADYVKNVINCQPSQQQYFECFNQEADCPFQQNLMVITQYIFLVMIIVMVSLWIMVIKKNKSKQLCIIYFIASNQQLGSLFHQSLSNVENTYDSSGLSNDFIQDVLKIFQLGKSFILNNSALIQNLTIKPDSTNIVFLISDPCQYLRLLYI